MGSPNMGLSIPAVGITAGPLWAQNLDSSLNLIDAHDHTPGNGVPITPSGMNINTDFPLNGNNITQALTVQFNSQPGTLTGSSLISVINGDFWFNNGSGTPVQITIGSSVAGASGTITGLVSPASATYLSGSTLFRWWADSNKSAAMDNGAVTIRETNITSSHGVTLQAPSGLAGDYTLTLPSANPGSSPQYMTSTNTGTLSFTTPDGVASAMSVTGADIIASTMDATGANTIANTRTRAIGTSGSDPGAGGISVYSTGLTYTNTTTSYTPLPNTCTLTTSGRPVAFGFAGAGASGGSSIAFENLSVPNAQIEIQIINSITGIFASFLISSVLTGCNSTVLQIPLCSINGIDFGPAGTPGTYTYTIQAKCVTNPTTLNIFNAIFYVYEI